MLLALDLLEFISISHNGCARCKRAEDDLRSGSRFGAAKAVVNS